VGLGDAAIMRECRTGAIGETRENFVIDWPRPENF
jgi:hypothetical protein